MESPDNGSDVENSMKNLAQKDLMKKKRDICFQWIQLISAILIPIIIAVYTVVDSKSNEEIAEANRRKDLQIAEANRLNEIQLGEQSRYKDRELSIDQQQENILFEYQTFLSQLILDKGNNLNKSSEAKTVAQFMTLTALDQLNFRRKSILLRSLHRANLITFKKNEKIFNESIINLEQADLSHVQFGLSSNQTDKLPMYRYIIWNYLWLPRTILINASFRHTLLDCATFTESIMDFVDLSFAAHTHSKCFDPIGQSQTTFMGVSLIKANMYNVRFRLTDFSFANLAMANMENFECIECHFSVAILSKVNLNFSRISHTFLLDKNRLLFDHTNFSHAIIHSAVWKSINFTKSDWSNVQASQIGIYNSTFSNGFMENSSLIKSNIQDSIYENINLYRADFSYAKFYNVTFIYSNMRYVNMSFIQCTFCSFIQVNFQDSSWYNITLYYSIFRDCYIDLNQLLRNGNDILQSKLINGTKELNLGQIDHYHRILYFIRVKTNDRIALETYMNVYLTIFGETNHTRETELKTSDHYLNKFQPGQIDNFTFQFDDLGQIKFILIKYDENTYQTKWFLDWIEIDIPTRDEFYKFPCNSWLNKSQLTNEYQIELKPSEIIKKNIMVTYQVTVYTGDVFGAGTDADVQLIIYGEYRDSNTHQLIQSKTNTNIFERNQQDIFEIQTLLLGKLKRIEFWLYDQGAFGSMWFLDRIEIRIEKTNQIYHFVCQNWIAASDISERIDNYEIFALENSQIESKLIYRK